MTVVVDVSAAIEMLLKKEKKDLFDATYRSASWVIAPDLYVSELSNALWKYHKASILSHEECVQHVEDGIALVDDLFEGKELWKEALSESIKNSHPVYDMYYLILARRNDATVITNDRKLADLCRSAKIEVVS
jgi:predicted nucleic acid-binding protein